MRRLQQQVGSSGRVPAVTCRALHTLRDVREDLVSKRRSAVEITQHYLDTLSRTEGVLNSFITVDAERSLKQVSGLIIMHPYPTATSHHQPHPSPTSTSPTPPAQPAPHHPHSTACVHAPVQAEALDAHIAREGTKQLGPLAGVPIAIKVHPSVQRQ